MNRKLILAALALGLFVPSGVKTFAAPIPSDVVFFGGTPFNVPENGPTEFFRAPLSVRVVGAVQLTEPGQPSVVSDQLWFQPGSGVPFFASDPNLVDLGAMGIPIVANLPETGAPQDISQYFTDFNTGGGPLPPGTLEVQSDLNVPEPATLALLATVALPLLVARHLRSRRSRLRAARVG